MKRLKSDLQRARVLKDLQGKQKTTGTAIPRDSLAMTLLWEGSYE